MALNPGAGGDGEMFAHGLLKRRVRNEAARSRQGKERAERNGSVHITGINTHFASDTTVVAENGVTAGTPGITDATHLSVTLTIPSGTPPGQISLTAKTPSASDEDATITNGFTNSTPSNLPSVVLDAPGANAVLAGTVEISGWVRMRSTP